MTTADLFSFDGVVDEPTVDEPPVDEVPVIATSRRYRCVVADPPWPMKIIRRRVTPNQTAMPYRTLTLDAIGGMKLPFDTDCHVWLWTTQKYLPAALTTFARWRVKYVFTMTWFKGNGFQPFGLPMYDTEFVLYGRVGTPRFVETRAFSTSLHAPRQGHSAKPSEFYALVRRVCEGPRLDVFNRRAISGFEVWGDQANGGQR